ncbi:nicotinate phosphoribosyltransferase [Mycoplasma marinum]|uniref:nicotinate phosphoribosyltransferase n=1 Tax=Mycoplasma marinum TaxID=1937190 RepID=A0A4R0XPH2_9MOLU|nr:nicotinate phosphoribosyltransferase [Mycoplasma marinum]TCG10795.1 nicotinate phosphoribosyltransferase [Mycoplasma marinum]
MYKNIKNGYYSAKYFFKTKEIIQKHKNNSKVTIQFFQRENNVTLCGINQVLKILKECTPIDKYKIKYLEEGKIINSGDVVLELEGKFEYFGILEGVIDGILARQTSIATNSRKIKEIANNKPVIFMGDRADSYINQENDGYAVSVGGLTTHVTNAQIKNHGGISVGTVPHALIQMFGGDLIEALKAYKDTFPSEDLVALVDFNNDVINDSLKALKEFGKDLKALRVDTSDGVSDKFFKRNEEFGVTPNLIKALRKALDKNGGKHVKIIVSSGFNISKIRLFEEQDTPVDIYGVGGSILKINIGFTGDAVKIDGKECAKFGRGYKDTSKLKVLI